MIFQLISLDGMKFDGDAYEVLIPTLDGDIAVLHNHEPLISALRPGPISVRKKAGGEAEIFASFGGVLEVQEGGIVRVLVDAAEHGEEISAAEAQKALESALKLKADAKDQISLDNAQALIDRQTVRLNIANLKIKRRN